MPKLEEQAPELVAEAVSRAVVDAVAQGGDLEAIVARALSRVKSELGLSGRADGSAPHNPGPAVPTPRSGWVPPARNGYRGAALGSGKRESGGVQGRTVITEGDILMALASGNSELRLPPGAIVTALARDAARDGGLRLLEAG